MESALYDPFSEAILRDSQHIFFPSFVENSSKLNFGFSVEFSL